MCPPLHLVFHVYLRLARYSLNGILRVFIYYIFPQEEEFVQYLMKDQPSALGYFPCNVKLNMVGMKSPLQKRISMATSNF